MSGSSSVCWPTRKFKTPQKAYEERRERRRRQMGFDLLPITLESIVDHENLYEVFKKCRQGGQAPGIDQVRYDDLTNSEVGEIMRELSKVILNGTYRPHKTRVVTIPKPGSSEMRKLNLGVLCDRVVAKALDIRMKPFWESTFLPCSYGFREGGSPWKMLADLEVQMERQGRWVLALEDVKNAFGNVPIQEVLECHRTFLNSLPVPEGKKARNEAKRQQERLLWLVDAVVRGNNSTRNRGIDQGNPYSPTCLNVVFYYHLDLPLLATSKKHPLRWFRYADNLVCLSRSVSEGGDLLGKLHQLLQPLGMTLKGKDGVSNLARGEKALLLGFSLSKQGDQVAYDLGKEALNHLAQNMSLAHGAYHPEEFARQSLLGWIQSAGPAYENGVTVIPTILHLAAQYGFRELASPVELGRHWKVSWERWRKTREWASRYRQG